MNLVSYQRVINTNFRYKKITGNTQIFSKVTIKPILPLNVAYKIAGRTQVSGPHCQSIFETAPLLISRYAD